ncbi:hypothetical protein KJF94_15055 [Pseudomonas hormoni]|uniref:Tsi6 domain-containing protein n=1 Tax=Pseudomonas hormoni TaxID=3093767 RepID=A0ABX8ERE7_9PSED|nr:hypothetical protein [Pseudomonas hormoni]QVW21238.1 hypothetical protein KJF94_15055 [Pseudomonas hormoni]
MLSDSLRNVNKQIEKTIAAIRDKCIASDEVVVADYLKRYEASLALIGTGSKQKLEVSLRGLLNCTRGYLETTSHYDQEFLGEMCETERLIKQLLKDKLL